MEKEIYYPKVGDVVIFDVEFGTKLLEDLGQKDHIKTFLGKTWIVNYVEGKVTSSSLGDRTKNRHYVHVYLQHQRQRGIATSDLFKKVKDAPNAKNQEN